MGMFMHGDDEQYCDEEESNYESDYLVAKRKEKDFQNCDHRKKWDCDDCGQDSCSLHRDYKRMKQRD